MNDVAVRVACVVAVALALAGCGSRSANGRHVFESRCAACHTLTGHDTQVEGGDLALGPLTVADVESFARVMPVHPPLTQAELRAVASYVVDRRKAFGH